MDIKNVNSLNFGNCYLKRDKNYKINEKQDKVMNLISDLAYYNNHCVDKITSLDAFAGADVFVVATKDGNVDLLLKKQLKPDDAIFNEKGYGRLLKKFTIPVKSIKAGKYGERLDYIVSGNFKDFLDESCASKCPDAL